jgi:hypothetical protein
MSISIHDLNDQLAGRKHLVELKIVAAGYPGYDLEFSLANSEGITTTVRCRDISALQLPRLGQQLFEVGLLRAFDVSARQLERIKFYFSDRVSESFSFSCASVTIESQQ